MGRVVKEYHTEDLLGSVIGGIFPSKRIDVPPQSYSTSPCTVSDEDATFGNGTTRWTTSTPYNTDSSDYSSANIHFKQL